MSIFFNIGRNTTPDFVELDSQFITVKNLKTLISRKIGVKQQDMKIKNVITFVEYAPNQYIKKGSSVNIEITARNLVDEPLKFHEIISNERLEAMMTDCRFYMVKSSNEDNIQKARDCSVWATTFLNQDKFKNAFQCYKHVFFFFGTNRSHQLKGLARMESQPDKMPDKSIWNGVSNIRLGGNFKIRWIRKKPLSLTTIEKKLGVEAKEEISKAIDGYEPDKEISKKVALLFELPLEPYYKLEDLVDSKKEKAQGRLNMSIFGRQTDLVTSQLASVMLKNIQQSSSRFLSKIGIDQLGLSDEIPQPVIMLPLMNTVKKEIEKVEGSSAKKKSKKDKKSKKKKHSKKSRRRHSSVSSSSSESRSRSRSRSSSSSSSSSRSDSPRKRRQKDRATQKRAF